MPTVTGPFFALEARGSLAGIITAQRQRGTRVVRHTPRSDLPPTPDQQYQRAEWPLMLSAFTKLAPVASESWHAATARRRRTALQLWLAQNANPVISTLTLDNYNPYARTTNLLPTVWDLGSFPAPNTIRLEWFNPPTYPQLTLQRITLGLNRQGGTFELSRQIPFESSATVAPWIVEINYGAADDYNFAWGFTYANTHDQPVYAFSNGFVISLP